MQAEFPAGLVDRTQFERLPLPGSAAGLAGPLWDQLAASTAGLDFPGLLLVQDGRPGSSGNIEEDNQNPAKCCVYTELVPHRS